MGEAAIDDPFGQLAAGLGDLPQQARQALLHLDPAGIAEQGVLQGAEIEATQPDGLYGTLCGIPALTGC